ncbi:MAG: putative dsRNA-binding protein [Bacteroidales bacterium]|nr:putative dsRNA-binding protein [Bacteroidales bacterium]
MFLLYRKKNNTLIHERRKFRSELKKLLGFRPVNLRLYEMAFIHRSATYTLPDGVRINNERLEYLGDAIIDSILSDYLFRLYPEAPEGFLTKTRARIVNRETLNNLGLSMGLDRLIVSNLAATDSPRNLYGNAVEALVGALFIDTGFDRTSRFFIERGLKKHLNLGAVLASETDYKSMILEYCQKNKQKLNFTSREKPSGTGLQPLFTVTLEINNEEITRGTGATKKEAEQEASLAALKMLGLLKT